MNETKRPYRMDRRAQKQAETRRRIVEATMLLHEEIGPRATTISAIADRAGVQRLTVYNHFPDETAVFQACTSHWLSLNPPPDPAAWGSIADPMARFRAAISALYEYFSGTRKMWRVAFRDVDDVPALQAPMREVASQMTGIASELVAAFGTASAQPKLAPTIRHCLHFLTWSNLEEQSLSDEEKIDLVCSWVDGARHVG